jgi:hypothetical protein
MRHAGQHQLECRVSGISLFTHSCSRKAACCGLAVDRTPAAWGVFVVVAFELAKELGWYVAQVPTDSVVYGAFATVPIFLLSTPTLRELLDG